MLDVTPLFHANMTAKERVVVNQGGTSSGKTYSIMQVLFVMGIEQAGLIMTVVGQDIPNLKKGSYRDAKAILAASEQLAMWYPTINESERIIRCTNGSIIEFSSYQDEQDARNGKRDVAFFNEANGISYEIFWQIYMRTRLKVFIDYNPSARFWVHEKLIGKPDVRLIISDHRSNRFLSEEQHDMIEGIDDDELWKVYARGVTGKITGLVYTNWDIVEELPPQDEWKMVAYGLDWGFVNDSTALVKVVLAHGDLWIDELIYEIGLTNPQIATKMKEHGITSRDEVIADSAEMKSIAELNGMGLRVAPCVKGAGSVNNGIDIVKRYKLHVTRRSSGLRKELLNYKWKVNKDGEPTNEPVDFANHCFTEDTLVTTDKGEKKIIDVREGDFVKTSRGFYKVCKIFENGCRKVRRVRIIFCNFAIEIEATPDHLFKTSKGWKQLQELKATDILYLTPSSLMGAGTKKRKAEDTEQVQDQIEVLQETYGNTTTEKNRQRKVFAGLGMEIRRMYQKIISSVVRGSISKEKNRENAQTLKVKSSTDCCTTGTEANDISREEQERCTVTYGSSIMEIYRKGIMYTIKMATLPTMIYRIWNYISKANTSIYTQSNTEKTRRYWRNYVPTWQRQVKSQKSGIIQRKEESGIMNTQNVSQQICSRGNMFASVVVRLLSKSHLGKIFFAQIIASRNGEGITTLMTRKEFASIAERNSQQTNIASHDSVLSFAVQDIIVISESNKQVYDIEVEDVHEFFANGILVHNCLDALRYVCSKKLNIHPVVKGIARRN